MAVKSSCCLVVALLFCVCWFSVESSQRCDLPPRFWCSSKRIARACQVEDQCEANVWSKSESKASKVNFTLYYESLCPDCQFFFSDQLSSTYSKLKDIMNLELVPYGNARQKQVEGKWEFTCQHGPSECLGNLIETCALHLYSNVSVVFPFIDCMEKSDDTPDISGPQCSKQTGFDYKAISECVNGPLGNKLEHEMGLKTEKLDPPHQCVPWVTLNGVHTDDIENEAEKNLLKLICDTYKGKKPAACVGESKPRKCLNY